jgi:hypothetical protein
VAATVVNRTNATLTVGKGKALAAGQADTLAGGFSLQFRDRHSRFTSNITALPARAYDPALPPTLPPGARWTGTFAGAGRLPAGAEIHIGVGIFRGPRDRDPYGFTLVTTRSFTRP